MADEFIDVETERALLAAIAKTPETYWLLLDLLPVGAFAVERGQWEQTAKAVEDSQPLDVPPEWAPTEDPEAAARTLADLFQRRLLAAAQERLGKALYDRTQPAHDVAAVLEEEVQRVQQAVREMRAGQLNWAADLIAGVLAEAEERAKQREETGQPVVGMPTGLPRLDEVIGGWRPGLHILAGAPGKGKTTLALQFALDVARRGEAAVYVTYENSPASLVLKAICAQAGIVASEVERGNADIAKLREGAAVLRPTLGRLALLEGTQKLTVPQVRAKALAAMNHCRAKRCFIVFDYLQQAAHGTGFDVLRYAVGKLVGELRDLATRLESPVLTLSSQSRSGGDYGTGGGSAALDSLKESGDLEYAADSVMFLTDDAKTHATPPARAILLTVAKNRFGATGVVPLIFRPDIGVMREVERR